MTVKGNEEWCTSFLMFGLVANTCGMRSCYRGSGDSRSMCRMKFFSFSGTMYVFRETSLAACVIMLSCSG